MSLPLWHFTSLSGLVWIETGKTMLYFRNLLISPAFRGWYGLKLCAINTADGAPENFTSLSGLVWIET